MLPLRVTSNRELSMVENDINNNNVGSLNSLALKNITFQPNEEEEESGLEKDRVINNILNEELICPICQKILWQPHSCSNCECHFCKFCLEKWLQTSGSNKCPNKCEMKIKKPAPILMSILKKLKIKCKYSSYGCNLPLEYESITKHQSTCEFEPIICQYCLKPLYKKDLTTHYDVCKEYLIDCKTCHQQIKRSDMNEHTALNCLSNKINNIELLFKEQLNELGSSINKLDKVFNKKLSKIEKILDLGFGKDYHKKQASSIYYKNLEGEQVRENIPSDSNDESQDRVHLSNNPERITEEGSDDEARAHEVEYDLLGIHYNISLQSLLNAGWEKAYFKGYDHKSTNDELSQLKDDLCNDFHEEYEYLVCVGAVNENDDADDIILCGIDYVANALRKTNSLYKAVHGSNDIYWYWVEDKAFGFSPKPGIWLSCADHAEKHCCSARLSWCVHGSCGGSRLGNLSGLTEANYKKLILIKKLPNQVN